MFDFNIIRLFLNETNTNFIGKNKLKEKENHLNDIQYIPPLTY